MATNSADLAAEYLRAAQTTTPAVYRKNAHAIPENLAILGALIDAYPAEAAEAFSTGGTPGQQLLKFAACVARGVETLPPPGAQRPVVLSSKHARALRGLQTLLVRPGDVV